MKPKSTKRGICRVCGYSIKLSRVTGAVQSHQFYSLSAPVYQCSGSGQLPQLVEAPSEATNA